MNNNTINQPSDALIKAFEELTDLIKLGRNLEFVSKLKYYRKTLHFDINMRNEYENTLLHIACRNRSIEIVEFLIGLYNIKVDIQNADGRTPLHIAAIYGATDRSYYTSNIGNTKNKIANSSTIINLLIDRSPYTLLIRDNNNMTPVDYFNIHSDPDTNSKLKTKYKNYKRNNNFFETLRKSGITKFDYDLTMSIFLALH